MLGDGARQKQVGSSTFIAFQEELPASILPTFLRKQYRQVAVTRSDPDSDCELHPR